jgi:beta-lactamase class A
MEDQGLKGLRRVNSIIIIALFLCGPLFAQNKIPPVEKQAQEIVKYFANTAGCEKIFTQDFLAEVPKEKITGIFKYYFGLCGGVVKIVPVKTNNEFSAQYEFYFEKNYTVNVTIEVETKEPYLVRGLFFGNPVTLVLNFDELIKELKKLPGETSFFAAKLSGGKVIPVAEYNPGAYLGIGSSFKLYILSELLRTVNNGDRKWSDVVTLREESVSMPSGFLHTWHTGTYMTLESLASLMISISDNTATDNLLYIAGRENVEKMLSVTGHSKPELNIPFLATMEMFKLKGGPDKELATKYLASADRKKFVNEELPKIKKEDVSTWSAPLLIDKIEWFASAKDLCNVMNWLRANSENEKGNRVRNILSINPGLSVSKVKWNYIGYKGGSEPGVMSMTYLLCSSKGEWFALSCGWNNTKAPVHEGKFAGLVGSAIHLLEN